MSFCRPHVIGDSLKNTVKNTVKNTQICLTVLIAAVTLAGCTPSKPKQGLIPLTEDSQKIVSTRPQMLNTHMMVILKLKSPALLNYSEKQNGKTIIDSVYLDQVKKEQDNVLAELKKISSDIQVVYKYKYVLNAVCIIVPNALMDQVAKLGLISTWENVGVFSRPESIQALNVADKDISITEKNSAKFIGAEKLNQLGITGKGIKVGVLDTGIDYTHSMFGGIGTKEAYKAVNPSEAALGYPNQKVVGGIDLVGTHYDGASPDFRFRVPKPDVNPIDEGGHGTHVAGSVAGLGDGINSYNGMAPEADLYSIKVFGADGSTSDMVVIAGLEFAVDPNGDDDLGDQLDVVNLSLGSSYGNPKLLYSEAVKNLANGGTISIISAGNSGDKDYIVGAPGTSTEALSVAASIDDGFHNWNFAAIEISINGEKNITEAIEATGTKPIAETDVSGELVFIGLADTDLSDEVKQKVNGKIALIDRGVVSFNDKIARAVSAGAIGVVVANNVDSAPIRMSSEKHNIPAVMITKALGSKIKTALAQNQTAQIQFKSDVKIQKPEMIDMITGFSSKGPRSMDGFLKPEISAPGSDIISAAMGEGNGIVQLSGTSMAAPHMAGVMALVKQSFKKREIEMSALELKHVAMGTAKTIGFTVEGKLERYPVTRQGSGRIQADVAANAEIVANLPSISFGEINIEVKKTMASDIQIRNLTNKIKNLSIEFVGNRFIQMKKADALTLAGTTAATIKLQFTLDSTGMKEAQVREMDGWVLVKENNQEIYRIPVLAVANTLSAIKADELKIESSKMDADGSVANLKLSNATVNSGEVLLFNHLGSDVRKPLASSFMSSDCDLQSVGYRIVDRENPEDGKNQKMIQFAVKVYKPATTWNSCDVSILIDQNKDGEYEQELLGAVGTAVPGLKDENHMSILIDATKARALRKAYEEKVLAANGDPVQVAKFKDKESYAEALLAMNDSMNYNNSTIVVVEAPVEMIKVNERNEINFQVIVTHNEQNSTETDDYLSLGKAANSAKWLTISANEADQGFLNLGQKIEVLGHQKQEITLTKGRGNQSLMLLAPQNKFSFSDSLVDAQLIVVKPSYGN